MCRTVSDSSPEEGNSFAKPDDIVPVRKQDQHRLYEQHGGYQN